MITQTKLTLEKFLAMPQGDITHELVDGEAILKCHQKDFILV